MTNKLRNFYLKRLCLGRKLKLVLMKVLTPTLLYVVNSSFMNARAKMRYQRSIVDFVRGRQWVLWYQTKNLLFIEIGWCDFFYYFRYNRCVRFETFKCFSSFVLSPVASTPTG